MVTATRLEESMDVVRWTGKGKPTQEKLRFLLQAEGLTCTLYADSPGTKYGRHKHDFDDFVVIVSGQMKIGTDNHQWLMKPGDRLNIPSNIVHWAEMVGKEEVQYLSLAR